VHWVSINLLAEDRDIDSQENNLILLNSIVRSLARFPGRYSC
jgi:hypothetical protein